MLKSSFAKYSLIILNQFLCVTAPLRRILFYNHVLSSVLLMIFVVLVSFVPLIVFQFKSHERRSVTIGGHYSASLLDIYRDWLLISTTCAGPMALEFILDHKSIFSAIRLGCNKNHDNSTIDNNNHVDYSASLSRALLILSLIGPNLVLYALGAHINEISVSAFSQLQASLLLSRQVVFVTSLLMSMFYHKMESVLSSTSKLSISIENYTVSALFLWVIHRLWLMASLIVADPVQHRYYEIVSNVFAFLTLGLTMYIIFRVLWFLSKQQFQYKFLSHEHMMDFWQTVVLLCFILSEIVLNVTYQRHHHGENADLEGSTKQDRDQFMASLYVQVVLTIALIVIPGRAYMLLAEIKQQKLNTRLNLIRYVSHEMRTPLNTAFLGLEMMNTDLQNLKSKYSTALQRLESLCDSISSKLASELPEDVVEITDTVKQVQDSCKVAVETLDDLLTFDKLDESKLVIEVNDVNPWLFLCDTTKPFELNARQLDVNFSVAVCDEDEIIPQTGNNNNNGHVDSSNYYVPDPLWLDHYYMKCDKFKLAQVLRNLCSNALKFTPAMGSVDVRVALITLEASKLSEDLHVSEGGLGGIAAVIRISVRDSGAGISAENQKKLFGQYVQFNASKLQQGKGSGLGLWISKSIVEMHGGKIWAYSEGEGKGATFGVDIPAFLYPQFSNNKVNNNLGALLSAITIRRTGTNSLVHNNNDNNNANNNTNNSNHTYNNSALAKQSSIKSLGSDNNNNKKLLTTPSEPASVNISLLNHEVILKENTNNSNNNNTTNINRRSGTSFHAMVGPSVIVGLKRTNSGHSIDSVSLQNHSNSVSNANNSNNKANAGALQQELHQNILQQIRATTNNPRSRNNDIDCSPNTVTGAEVAALPENNSVANKINQQPNTHNNNSSTDTSAGYDGRTERADSWTQRMLTMVLPVRAFAQFGMNGSNNNSNNNNNNNNNSDNHSRNNSSGSSNSNSGSFLAHHQFNKVRPSPPLLDESVGDTNNNYNHNNANNDNGNDNHHGYDVENQQMSKQQFGRKSETTSVNNNHLFKFNNNNISKGNNSDFKSVMDGRSLTMSTINTGPSSMMSQNYYNEVSIGPNTMMMHPPNNNNNNSMGTNLASANVDYNSKYTSTTSDNSNKQGASVAEEEQKVTENELTQRLSFDRRQLASPSHHNQMSVSSKSKDNSNINIDNNTNNTNNTNNGTANKLEKVDHLFQFSSIKAAAAATAAPITAKDGTTIANNSDRNNGNTTNFTNDSVVLATTGSASNNTVHSIANAATATADVEEAPSWERGLHILIVDDAPTNRKMLKKLLSSVGHTVYEAVDGVDCLEQLDYFRTSNNADDDQYGTHMRYPHAIDVVLMDEHMPRMDGPDCVATLKAKGFVPPIFAITGSVSREETQHFLACGATAVFAKPLQIPLLKQAVNNYFAQKTSK